MIGYFLFAGAKATLAQGIVEAAAAGCPIARTCPLLWAASATREAAAPLERGQIDHSPIDLIVVDERDR